MDCSLRGHIATNRNQSRLVHVADQLRRLAPLDSPPRKTGIWYLSQFLGHSCCLANWRGFLSKAESVSTWVGIRSRRDHLGWGGLGSLHHHRLGSWAARWLDDGNPPQNRSTGGPGTSWNRGSGSNPRLPPRRTSRPGNGPFRPLYRPSDRNFLRHPGSPYSSVT